MDGITITFSGRNSIEVRKEMLDFLWGISPDISNSEKTKENVSRVVGMSPLLGMGYQSADAVVPAAQRTNVDCQDAMTGGELVAGVDTPPLEKKKRASKKKDEVKVDAPVPPAASIPASEDPTLDNCRNWVKAVAASKSLNDAQNIVIAFGVSKVGDLPEEKFPDFIADCKKAIEGIKSDSQELFA